MIITAFHTQNNFVSILLLHSLRIGTLLLFKRSDERNRYSPLKMRRYKRCARSNSVTSRDRTLDFFFQFLHYKMASQRIKRSRIAESDDDEYQMEADNYGSSSQMPSTQRVKTQPMTTNWDDEVNDI